MRFRQLCELARLFNGESAWPVTTLQILESVDRDTGCTSCELQESRFLLRIPSTNTLDCSKKRTSVKLSASIATGRRFHAQDEEDEQEKDMEGCQKGEGELEFRSKYLPEIDNDLVRLGIASIIGMLLPVVNVNIGDTADEQLQFSFVKDVDKILRDQLVEAIHIGAELLLDSFLDPPFREETRCQRQRAHVIDIGGKGLRGTNSTYSCLFAFVTGIFRPSGFRSISSVSPNRSSSVEKAMSRSSTSFSLPSH